VGDAAWLRLGGLGLDDPGAHGALSTSLERLGMGLQDERLRPQIVVLDWSVVNGCSAEGLAFFAVLARRFIADGVHVIATEPQRMDVKDVLVNSGLQDACAGVRWIPCHASGQRTVESSARAALFYTGSNESLDEFCDDVSATLERLAVSRMVRRAVMGTTQEMLHNVSSHAGADHGAATALFFPRRRPRILQIGIADDGLGIASTVLRDPRHEWLAWFSDARVTGAVIRDNLSGRGPSLGMKKGAVAWPGWLSGYFQKPRRASSCAQVRPSSSSAAKTRSTLYRIGLRMELGLSYGWSYACRDCTSLNRKQPLPFASALTSKTMVVYTEQHEHALFVERLP
jgi:hypothetical protein